MILRFKTSTSITVAVSGTFIDEGQGSTTIFLYIFQIKPAFWIAWSVNTSRLIPGKEDESSFDIPYYRERVYPDGETEFNFLGLISKFERSSSKYFFAKSYEVNTGFSDYDIDLLHDSMSIELINHEASETQFLGSKQFYGSCEDRFGNNFVEFNDQHIIIGKSKSMTQ